MKGLTLIELMLALFLSTLILSSVITIYLETQSILQKQQAISTIIENSNLAFHFLISDLKKTPNDNTVKPFFDRDTIGFTIEHATTHENNTYFIGKTRR